MKDKIPKVLIGNFNHKYLRTQPQPNHHDEKQCDSYYRHKVHDELIKSFIEHLLEYYNITNDHFYTPSIS